KQAKEHIGRQVQRASNRHTKDRRHVIARSPGDGLGAADRGDDDRPPGAHRFRTPCEPKPLPTALRTRRNCQAKGRVSRTTPATSSIAAEIPTASPKSPYKAGDKAPAPTVPV